VRASARLVAALLAVGASASAEEGAPRAVLRWQAIPGAAAYDLQIAREPSFAKPELDVRVEMAGHRFGLPPDDVRRYWRVRSVDAEGRPGPWSETKIIVHVVRPVGPPIVAAPEPEPEPMTLDVPPLPPEPLAVLEEPAPSVAEAVAPVPLAARGDEELRPSTLVPDWTVDEGSALGFLEWVRPGVLMGWRANLLGVDAPEVTVESTPPLPWLGAHWWSALRVGWWRERVAVPTSVGFSSPRPATADVLPITALLLRTLPSSWGRLYAGGGAGVHLAVVRFRGEGALEASGSLVAVAGAGRRAGAGELFCELAGGLGGVDGPLGWLRTGGISLAVGYRLSR
jgi:hypothetical protein